MEIKGLENKIINADCMDILKQLPDKCIDLVLTDPPYGIGYDNIATKYSGTRQGNGLGIRGNYFANMLSNSKCWLVWDKHINGDFADCELAWTSFDKPVKKYDFLWNGMLQQNMKNKEVRIHPTQKPADLFGMILRDYSKEGDLILDCFSGSGTTAIACHRLKRRFICIEKDPEYWKASCKRLEDEQRQGVLF